MTYYNYLGRAMPETAPEQSNISGTSAGGETIQAPAGNSSASGEGGGDTLIGSSGDNTFFITDGRDVVVEQPGGGIDTESGYMPLALAPNVENLLVHKDFNHGLGNSLDNLIITDGRAWLDGAGGNDVLVGATNTTTTFVEHAGEGSDVIYNWQGADQVQLTGFAFKTPADVRAAMTQQGQDVVLALSASQTLTFRNTTVSTSFQDKQFLLPLDASKLGKLTFDDEFNTLSLYDPSHKTGTWSVDFGGNLKDQWAYSIPSNGEMEVYLHDGFEGLGASTLHINPFSVADGVLSITAHPLPAQDTPAAFGHSWSSGMINTLDSFEQKYGYFEMRAQLPNVAGSWPAFWMRPSPYVPQQEADVMESIGLQPSQDYRFAWGSTQVDDHALKLDPNGWHTYGMLWTKDQVSFYMDGVEVLKGPTPATWTNPMGMIVNMAMGGWGGEADPADYPASLKIDYVRAYALADGSSQVVTSTPTTPTATLQDEAQPTSIQAQSLVFDDTGAPLASGKIVLLSHAPTAADVPASGRSFIVWESGGQVRGAVANNGYLDTPTTLAAGSISQFTGQGTFLTDGRVVVAHTGTDGGQPAAYDLIFDPATHKIQDHELGPASGQVSFVSTANGNFAASWHAPDGTIEGRAYDAFAYDSQGWWGPVRELAGDAAGVTALGDLITGSGTSRTAYHLEPFVLSTAGTVSIGPATVTHPEGDTGLTSYTFTVTRSDALWQRATVAWKVTGFGANPTNAADFAGGWAPSGVVTLQGGTTTASITIKVQGDTLGEPDEQFQVSLFHPVGTGLGTATATGVVASDDTGGATPGTIGFASASASVSHAEGNSGTTPFSFTVLRSGDASAAATVNWAVTGAGASPANAADFQGGVLPKGALSFGAGETSKVITVNVAGDTTVEGNDGFVVRLSGATGGTLGTATAAGHITNDDAGSGGSPGKVLTATHVGSTLTGGAGDDTLNASQADDTLTGGAGADRFVFGLEPWSPAHITDFKPGEDKIDLSALFDKAGYAGSDPVRDGYLYLQSDGGDGTLVRFDRDGAGPNPQWPNTIIDVEHVAPSQLSLGDWIV